MKKIKIISLLIILIIILLVVGVVLIKTFHNTEVECILNRNDNNFVVNYIPNQKIFLQYDNTYKSMDDTVDNYDSIKSYLYVIDLKDGVETDINQNEYNVTYTISVDLKEVKEENYDLLQISDLIKLKNKEEIKEYYEKLGYTCK